MPKFAQVEELESCRDARAYIDIALNWCAKQIGHKYPGHTF